MIVTYVTANNYERHLEKDAVLHYNISMENKNLST